MTSKHFTTLQPDLLERQTTIGLGPELREAVVPALAQLMAEAVGLPQPRPRKESGDDGA